MNEGEPTGKADQDWRLEAELLDDGGGALHGLVRRFRGPDVVGQVEGRVPAEVVVTHDGRKLFAYAASEPTLRAARAAIEDVLREDGIAASLRVSRWDGERDRWLQTDPPPSAQEQMAGEAADTDAEATDTRTFVASSGRLIRAEFEQTMLAWAERLGLECQVIEHPHMLTTQVAFTVTGPRRRIDEFSRGLAAEGWSMVRTETGVMLSPL
jgi:hypothetical protein